MNTIGRLLFALPSWRLQLWLARRIGKPASGNGWTGWAIGTKTLIFEDTDGA